MTTDTAARPDRMKWIGSNLALGLLVTVMSVFTAVANYATYVVSGTASDYETEGNRLLADSNTSYISASQFIIVDYAMYDTYYTNLGINDDISNYYEPLFSDSLKASVIGMRPSTTNITPRCIKAQKASSTRPLQNLSWRVLPPNANPAINLPCWSRR